MHVRAVIFDLYDTLFSGGGTDAWDRAIGLLAREGVAEGEWLRGWEGTYDAVVRRKHSIRQRARLALEAIGRREVSEQLLDELAGLLSARAYPRLFPDVRKAIVALRARGYRLGLLSNIPYDEAAMLDALDLPAAFGAVVLSSVVELVKPEPAIFHLMAERLGLPPEQCALVDDTPENVAAARGLGMAGVLMRRLGAEARPEHGETYDLRISGLEELLAWLPEEAGSGTATEEDSVE
jgi:putative hydrolase of the HAD superfamily